MSESTITTDPTPTVDPFASAFPGVTTKRTTTRAVDNITLTPAENAAFASDLGYFSLKNNNVRSIDCPDIKFADSLRTKVQVYANAHNLNASFPKYVAEHMSKAVVEEGTGKILKPSKLVPENNVPRHFNVGTNVTWRLVPKSDDSKPKNGPVTTTTVAQRAEDSKAAADATNSKPSTPNPATIGKRSAK